jgi:hypothetical protein
MVEASGSNLLFYLGFYRDESEIGFTLACKWLTFHGTKTHEKRPIVTGNRNGCCSRQSPLSPPTLTARLHRTNQRDDLAGEWTAPVSWTSWVSFETRGSVSLPLLDSGKEDSATPLVD